MRRPGHHRLHGKQGRLKGKVGKLSIVVVVLLICTLSLLFCATVRGGGGSTYSSEIKVEELWGIAKSGGWRPSSAPRSD